MLIVQLSDQVEENGVLEMRLAQLENACYLAVSIN